MSVPNQLFIDIHKTNPGQGEKFLSINTNEWVEASKILNPSAFQLYLYLANIQNGYKGWELSKEAVTNLFGFSDKTYTRAKKDLIDKQYLVEVKGNHYSFFTSPQDKNVPQLVLEETTGQKCPTEETKMSQNGDKNDYRNNKIIIKENNENGSALEDSEELAPKGARTSPSAIASQNQQEEVEWTVEKYNQLPQLEHQYLQAHISSNFLPLVVDCGKVVKEITTDGQINYFKVETA